MLTSMNTPTFLATYAPQYVRTILTDGTGPIEPHARRIADTIGIDPWDVELDELLPLAAATEDQHMWRPRLTRPGFICRYVRTVDLFVHVIFADMVEDRFPRFAVYLRNTSPRWGATWRNW